MDENIISDPEEIIREGKKFYHNLYSDNTSLISNQRRDEIIDNFTKSEYLPKLSEIGKNQCEDVLTESELLDSIKALKNGKTPGNGRFNGRIYRFFWLDIKYHLFVSIRFALENGIMSMEQSRAIISLLPKDEGNRIFLKHWRPISLLNVDYKILAKALAIRFTKYLPQLIDGDQTGYVKQRFIGKNISMIEEKQGTLVIRAHYQWNFFWKFLLYNAEFICSLQSHKCTFLSVILNHTQLTLVWLNTLSLTKA